MAIHGTILKAMIRDRSDLRVVFTTVRWMLANAGKECLVRACVGSDEVIHETEGRIPARALWRWLDEIRRCEPAGCLTQGLDVWIESIG